MSVESKLQTLGEFLYPLLPEKVFLGILSILSILTVSCGKWYIHTYFLVRNFAVNSSIIFMIPSIITLPFLIYILWQALQVKLLSVSTTSNKLSIDYLALHCL